MAPFNEQGHCDHPEVTMTDSGLAPLTRYSQLPITVSLDTSEIVSAVWVRFTAASHLRHRAEHPTSEERIPARFGQNQLRLAEVPRSPTPATTDFPQA
jgi:hypothetical protein